ncbi:MAG: hypothetical protein WD059_06480, partial [Balneolaceae bacterium]
RLITVTNWDSLTNNWTLLTLSEFDDLFPKVKIGEFKKFPIIIPSIKEQENIGQIVSKILTTKKENPEADTGNLEAEIDQLVYELYGLSEEEVKIVEGNVGE